MALPEGGSTALPRPGGGAVLPPHPTPPFREEKKALVERDGGFSPKCRFALSAILTEPVSNPLKLCLTGWAKLKGIRHATAVCAAVRCVAAALPPSGAAACTPLRCSGCAAVRCSAPRTAAARRCPAAAAAPLEPFQPRFV